MNNAGIRPELRALTGLRGVAATVVILVHFRVKLPYGLEFLFHWPHAAVDLFFCLSGFTLSYVYRREDFRFWRFLVARFGRVYPLYFLTLLVMGILWLFHDPAVYPRSAALSDLLLQLPMLNSWPIIGSGVHWNWPAWSISVEWFCYIALFPILLHLKPPSSVHAKLFFILSLLSVSYLMFVNYYDPHLPEVKLYAAKSQWSYWVSASRGICGFVVGWLAFASYEARDGLHAFCSRFPLLIWVGFGMTLTLKYFGLIEIQAAIFLFPFVVLAATDETSYPSRALGSPAIHFLGLISYSIYMMHLIIFAIFIGIMPGEWPLWTYVLLIASTLLVSTCSYFAIERPARNAIRESLAGRSKLVTEP